MKIKINSVFFGTPVILAFLLALTFPIIVQAQTNAKIYREQGGAKEVVVSGGEIEIRTGGLIDMQAGSTLTVNAAATLNISDTPTFQDLTVTYGVAAATGSFSSTLHASGQTTFGSGAGISTITASGALNVPLTITAGKGVAASTGAFSSTVDVTGALSAATVNTGQGANEVYPMDQAVQTTNTVTFVGMTLSGEVVETPLTSYSGLEISSSIVPSASFMVINGTGTLTFTSTPIISTTTASNGQVLELMGGANVVTFTDEGTLSGSLMEIGSTTRALGAGDILRLRYYDGKWYEISFINN